jgi:hypothetical protein
VTTPRPYDRWLLLSLVQQRPQGTRSFRLAELAAGVNTTGVVNDVRNQMRAHLAAGRVRAVYEPSEITYLPVRSE